MKLTIERAALLKALGHVQSVVERRNTIPILSNVLLRADGEAGSGALALSATDMDLEIIERVAAQIERSGRTTAPAHTLYDIVRKLPEGAQIEIEVSDGRSSMVLRCGRSTFTLACLPPEDYPIMASGELGHCFTVTAAKLRTSDRSHPLCDLDRGGALLPERDLSARDPERRRSGDSSGRHRWAPPCPR